MSAHSKVHPLLNQVGNDIDHLITLDLNRRGVISILYEAARASAGTPLVLKAAQKLSDNLERGSLVLFATGWPDRPWISPTIGELDGPPGAALLARCLHRVFSVVPIFLVERELVPAMEATARAAGFAVLTPEQSIASITSPAPLHAAAVLPFPTDWDEAATEAKRLLKTLNPRALIAVEKGSANDKGVIHNARGMDTTASMAKVDELVKACGKQKVLTIGIGDGGNEIGMGLIADAIRKGIAFGAECACPCKGGIAPTTPTDILVPASVSNWGAYGIAACVAVLTGHDDALHDEQTELRTLREAADAGLIDGNTGYVDPGADGIPATTHAAILTVLRQLVANAIHPTGLAKVDPKSGPDNPQRRL
jgi:hypothetical protein